MPTRTKQWQPLDLTTLVDCEFMACDPSLTALGIVHVRVHNGDVTVKGAEKLATLPEPEKKGWEDTFYRAELMEALIDAVVDMWMEQPTTQGLQGVHEAPPTGGGNLVRTESSILTGYAFRSVMSEYEVSVDKTVTPQSHKKLLCGNHIAGKKEHHEAIKALLPQIKGGNFITNEATRDALSIALYAAWRKGQ